MKPLSAIRGLRLVVVAKFYEELGEAHVTLETDHGGFYEELGEAGGLDDHSHQMA